ncbi:ABC transporter substrate-binding protein [Rhodococcus sp. 1163]|uniref:extracellular solute-binding protein n=1 Tax=unclassified Rhodococcus (in: high G+C Gram-positive bacteria) TaxID=192944 RepID=UPI000A055EC5|nr:extracellular solute-binding protein [Rhodococcus sp. 1163]ORI17698.1 ABC transporter substrate-binding protein [Rhodococcus sp. 1163]
MLAAAALVVTPLLAACGSSDSSTPVLSFYTAADGAEQYAAAAQACSAASGGRYTVEQRTLPKSANDQRLQLARRLAGNDSSLDLMTLDVVWTAEFAEAGWALPVPEELSATLRDGSTLEGPLATAQWQDQLYAVPLNSNTQLLWYRPDQVPGGVPPQTWDQLIDVAEANAAEGKPSYIGVQAKQYEGLMVWFNSLLVSAGGQVVGDDGTTVTLNDTPEHRAATEKALSIMKRVATADGADPSISQTDEATARLGLEAGSSAFEVNYPFVLPGLKENAIAGAVPFLDLSNVPADQQDAAIAEVFRSAPYPAVKENTPAKVTIGGFNIGVANTTQHEDLAWEAVACLTNEENQRNNAVNGGVPPVLRQLYQDPEFQAVYPAWEGVLNSIENSAVRPVSPAYQSISILLTDALNPPQNIDPVADVDKLADLVTKAVNSEGLIP